MSWLQVWHFVQIISVSAAAFLAVSYLHAIFFDWITKYDVDDQIAKGNNAVSYLHGFSKLGLFLALGDIIASIIGGKG